MTSPTPGKGTPERRKADRLLPSEIGRPVRLTPLAAGRGDLSGELVNVSDGGLAVWLETELPPGSHWLISMPDLEGAGVPAKMVRARPGFGAYVHGFQFSTHQATLARRLTGRRSF